MKKTYFICCVLLSLLSSCNDRKNPSTPDDVADDREWAHGISYIPLSGGNGLLLWSEATQAIDFDNGVWTHDVYYSHVSKTNPSIDKQLLIHADEAQEPTSASVSGDGKIIVTFEDGNDAGDYSLAQRYAIYDTNLNVIKAYPQTIAMGGHSGHAASTSEHHVVFWDEGWVDGGGVNNLGSGDDVYATILTSDGSIVKTLDVSVGEESRDCWPLLAASDDDKVLLVWQRMVAGALSEYVHICTALLDVKTGQLGSITVHEDLKGKFYTFFATYLPDIGCFGVEITLIDGTSALLLVDKQGQEVARCGQLPALLREQNPAIAHIGGVECMACATVSGTCLLKITPTYAVSSEILSNTDLWSYCGTALFWLDDTRFAVANIGQSNQLKIVEIK